MRTPSCSSRETTSNHCHGTLIVHASWITECTEEQCIDSTHSRHAFVIDCHNLAGGCRCAEDDTVRRRAYALPYPGPNEL
ncbi:hypothetical protein ACL02S_16845 [Nocardia sp. 004]|uniref:hypothetical protein n=1 Tax=Nocardia sp. 004 TaxID=3385978 RepID=UPI0039A3C17C